MRGRVRRFLRYHWLRITRARASSHAIALGLAIGVFVGFLPVIPFQTPLVLLLTLLLRCSKVAGLLGTWVANPIYLPAFYYMLYLVGGMVTPAQGATFDPAHPEIRNLIDGGWSLLRTMVAGGLILGVPAACCTYVLTVRGIRRCRLARRHRLSLRSQR